MIANEQTSACSVDLGHSSFRSACLLGEELPLAWVWSITTSELRSKVEGVDEDQDNSRCALTFSRFCNLRRSLASPRPVQSSSTLRICLGGNQTTAGQYSDRVLHLLRPYQSKRLGAAYLNQTMHIVGNVCLVQEVV